MNTYLSGSKTISVSYFLILLDWDFCILNIYLKGTGTRDLIWLKVVSLDRSWLVGLTDDLYKIF